MCHHSKTMHVIPFVFMPCYNRFSLLSGVFVLFHLFHPLYVFSSAKTCRGIGEHRHPFEGFRRSGCGNSPKQEQCRCRTAAECHRDWFVSVSPMPQLHIDPGSKWLTYIFLLSQTERHHKEVSGLSHWYLSVRTHPVWLPTRACRHCLNIPLV